MPVGQTLGARKVYAYISDDGNTYSVITDETLGDLTTMVKDDTNPRLPAGYKPRRRHFEHVTAGGEVYRKSLVMNAADPLYTGVAPTVTIDTLEFTAKGRTGETSRVFSN